MLYLCNGQTVILMIKTLWNQANCYTVTNCADQGILQPIAMSCPNEMGE